MAPGFRRFGGEELRCFKVLGLGFKGIQEHKQGYIGTY